MKTTFIDGITVLNTVEIPVYGWGFSLFGLIMAILGIAALILGFIAEEDVTLMIFAFSSAILIVISVATFCSAKIIGYEYKYEVLIDDSISFADFNKLYKIENQHGEIYTITFKENQ